MTHAKARLAGVVALGTVAVAIAAGGGAAAAERGKKAAERPNVVVVMSDDQTQASISEMPRVAELLGAKGATFSNSFTNWPLCCPSRATLLTGQYAHNHQVLGNEPPLGGFERLDTSETLAVWLQRAGYYTAHIGKFLNGYERSAVGVPPGWSEWHGSKRTYTFYGYELLEDGQLVTYGDPDEDPDNPADPASYSTDVYTDKAVELIGRRAPSRDPFFLSLAYLAPHGGGPNKPQGEPPTRCQGSAKPAVRHKGAYASEPLPTPPSFNEADVADKPTGIRDRAPLSDTQVAEITREYRCRLESLLAIDEGVDRIVAALRAAGELDNTLIAYTSDNGFFHGEHRIATGKNRVYEEAIRVPLLIRGPGLDKGVQVDELVTNADLAPTILDAAEAQPGRVVDGRSILRFARHPSRLRGRELLVEQDSYVAIRTERYVYAEYVAGENAGQAELYDLETDPFELINQAANPAYDAAEGALAARLAELRTCSGPSCREKPALEQKLPRRVRDRGRSCREPRDFLVRLRGSDADQVVEVTFRVGSKLAARDSSAPFKKTIRPRLLRRRARPEVRLIAELVDGRRLSLQKRVRLCR